MEAQKDTGLGTSQTAEVAYLDKLGVKYKEHDISEFEDFMFKGFSGSTKVSL